VSDCGYITSDDAYASRCIASNQDSAAKELTSYQNSSASRRFLSAPSRQSPGIPKRFNTPSASQSAPRFAKPTAVYPSTPISRTPPGKRLEDEIDTGFEEHNSSSPPLPSRLRFSSSLARPRDAIDDASDEDDILAGSRSDELSRENSDDDLSDLLYLEQLRGNKAAQPPKPEQDVRQTGKLSRKRRRICATETATEDVFAISSSPSPKKDHPTQISEDDDLQANITSIKSLEDAERSAAESEEEVNYSPIGTLSAITATRFRIPTPAVFPPPRSSTRPAFKLPPVQNVASLGQSATSSLPDAFSPSRRRGKKDYIPGGSADTVRNWVLALAAEESKTTQIYTESFRVVQMRDAYHESRCVLVEDEHGRKWILINESAKAGSDSMLRKVTVGCSVGIRISSTIPNLQPDYQEQLDIHGHGETNMPADEWSVAIMWDVLQ
jgi:hypothetical protein